MKGPTRQRGLWALVTLAVLVGLASCRRGADASMLKKEIQSRLDKSFGAGQFSVRTLRRKGHYPLGADKEGDRVLVYYGAEVTFLRARKLSDWDQTNVGSLISVLGATATSVRGVKTEGNKKGDVLTVRGACAFASRGGKWRAIAFTPTKADGALRSGPQLPYRLHAQRLLKIGAKLAKGRQSGELAGLTTDLSAVLERAERRLGRAGGALTLATGVPGGEYHRQGSWLSALLSANKHPSKAYPSAGSLENVDLVHSGEVLFAYAQSDIAAMAHAGTGVWRGKVPLSGLRALASLYPEAVQIVVRAEAEIASVAQLAGKRVEIGPERSGLRHNALQIFSAVGLSLRDFKGVGARKLAAALVALAEGQTDAVFVTSAFPNPAVEKLAGRAAIRLLGLAPGTIAKLTAAGTHLLPMIVPAKTYRGVDLPQKTVGVTAMLVAREDAPADKVITLLSQLFANVQKLSRRSRTAYFISKKTALKGVTVPLHPAVKQVLGGGV